MYNSVDEHKFKIGQTVSLLPGFGLARSGTARYQIIALLPSNGSHYQYRIQNDEERFERVAAENELKLRQN